MASSERPGPVIVQRRAHGVRNRLAGHGDAEGLGGLEDGDGVVGEAGHAAQPVRAGGEDARRRAEHLEQSAGKRFGIRDRRAPGQ